MVRAETPADVVEAEEANACTCARRHDEHHEISGLPLEPPVAVRPRARVAERPAIAGAPNGRANRCVLRAPRRCGASHEERESRLVCAYHQGAGAGCIAAKDGGGEASGDVSLSIRRRRICRRPRRTSRDDAQNQQKADEPRDQPLSRSTAISLFFASSAATLYDSASVG